MEKETLLEIIFIAGIVTIVLIGFSLLLESQSEKCKKALSFCQSQGYSYDYCVKGIYGN